MFQDTTAGKNIIENIEPTLELPFEYINNNLLTTKIVSIVVIVILTIIAVAQIIKWSPIDTFLAFQDIQRNFNKWLFIIKDYENLESNKISTLKTYMTDYNTLVCIDYGTYYIPAFFNEVNGKILPSAIRRGNGDAWIVTKSDAVDPAAMQQCLYVASEFSNNTVTCGLDMYNKLGYSGYLNSGHWCNTIKDKLYNIYKIL